MLISNTPCQERTVSKKQGEIKSVSEVPLRRRNLRRPCLASDTTGKPYIRFSVAGSSR